MKFEDRVARECGELTAISLGFLGGCSTCEEQVEITTYCPECFGDVENVVSHFGPRTWACGDCGECGSDEYNPKDANTWPDWEGSFSWSSCDGCGSTLGGDRYPAHGVDVDGQITHLNVCVDCLMYFANGDVPE